MKYLDLGLIDYKEAWNKQILLFNESVQNKIDRKQTENTLIFCEHPHVVTIGKSGKNENLLFPESFLEERGVSLFKIDRGGDITYHGPGQIVAYPIFDLESFGIGLKQYVFSLEEVIIRFLKSYGIAASRLQGATGVWLEPDISSKARKIAAIGVRSSRFVTMHGFALNINTDLSYFSLINPCGFMDKGVTSLEKETGIKNDIHAVKSQLKEIFEDVFQQKAEQ